MTDFILPADFAIWDALGLLSFLGGWLGFHVLAWRATRRGQSLTGAVGRMRDRWMDAMVTRDMRITDAQILSALLGNVTFFASTSILVLAGLFAALGAADEAMQLVTELPFAAPISRGLWEIKVGVLVAIFVYAFFKFGWCIRLHSYCSVMLGAVPQPEHMTAAGRKIAANTAKLSTIASQHFNDGVRAYYFGLAALSWFVHPLLLIPATVWVVMVLYRREFQSRSLALIKEALEA